MKYTREQIVKLGADKVRSTPDLFSAFKAFIDEDVCELYPNCRLPGNCFSCSYNNTFSKWKNYVININQKNQTKNNMSTKINYELVDKSIRIYFDGNVLSKDSSNEEWDRWINYPIEESKVQKRRDFFKKLPNLNPVKPKEKVNEITEDSAKTQSSENEKTETEKTEKVEVKTTKRGRKRN